MTVYGWDLSNHDWTRAEKAGRRVDLANAKAAGISLVTHKATEGDWYSDPYLDDFARQLATVAFPVAGTYHVLNHGIDVARQTDHWIARVESAWPNWRKHPCPIWQIDAEALDGYAKPTKAEIVACAQRLVAKLHVQPTQIVVYGPHWAYGEALLGLPYHLWASSYVDGSGSFKTLYPGDANSRWAKYSGQTPLILQYSSSATIGAQHQCDANAVRVSSAAALRNLFIKEPDMTPAELIAALNSAAGQAAIKKAVTPFFVGSDGVPHMLETITAHVTQGTPYYTGKGHVWPALMRRTDGATLATKIDAIGSDQPAPALSAPAPEDEASLAALQALDAALADEPDTDELSE